MRAGVCGFTLSLVLAHVCRASGETALVATPLQFFRLALLFLATADFRGQFYCLGREAGTPKTPIPKDVNALLEAAVFERNDAAHEAASTPSFTSWGGGVRGADSEVGGQELCVGLVEDACLFDSDEKTFNILWRTQLHIKVKHRPLDLGFHEAQFESFQG